MDNFIGIYNNAFEDDYCDEVISKYKWAESLGMDFNRQDVKNINKCEVSDSAVGNWQFPIEHINGIVNEHFFNKFWKDIYSKYSNKYLESLKENSDTHSIYSVVVQKTKPSQGYHKWHYEASNRLTSNRLLAFTVYLNDVDEGGETEFLYQQKRIKPEKGKVIIFPAAFTHLHRGNPPLSNDKYIITGWVEF